MFIARALPGNRVLLLRSRLIWNKETTYVEVGPSLTCNRPAVRRYFPDKCGKVRLGPVCTQTSQTSLLHFSFPLLGSKMVSKSDPQKRSPSR